MHYKNGREVKVGDKFVAKDAYGNMQAGTVVGLNPGCNTCNIAYIPCGTNTWSATAGDCLHVDDIWPTATPNPAQ